MNPIIVATDFSKPSANAAVYAADMAAYLKSDLILVHVIQIPATTFQVPMTEFEYEEIERGAETSLKKMQKELADRTKNKITISTEMKYGSVEPEVERMCYEIKPFALVVAGKSGNTLQRFFMGSTTLRMVHHILYPVLIVPADVSFSVVKNITVASDLQGDRENTSVLFTKKILQAFHASLKIIHVNTNHHSENSVQAGIDFLQHSFADFKPGFHFITKENVQSGIADYLKTNQTDLLIVMPERHGLLASLIQPSESNRVILHAHLPIMSVAVTKLPLTIAANKGQFPSLENELGLPANKKLAENQPDQTHSPI